ncbi:MAG: phytanoyl-CoA dioxygenase family protein [bacterium]|nr:phytanoyl-CoA dioxygenase family protein [bacterium]
MSWSDAFARDGYGAPFPVLDAEAAARVRAAADGALSRDGLDPRSRTQSRHLDVPALRELCEHPAILERVRAILGERIVLWRSNLFPKAPGEAEFTWHADRDHWKTLLDPMINVTAWIALERADAENGALQFRSRSSPERVLQTELDAGTCVLFDQDAQHRSGPNPTERRRLAIAVRYTVEGVRIDVERLFPGYRALALSR